MQNTKKLLSISNLKKYFPVAKSSIFQRQQLYVRANEDITLDIYQGETLGVVGESGCGKSTLGRVLLQLYPQTAGTTIYYGSTLQDTAPVYVLDTLKNLEKYKKKLALASKKVAELDRKVEEAGGEDAADFYLLQNRNLARCDEQTCLTNIVKIMGGFMVHDPNGQGRSLLIEQYKRNVRRKAAKEKYLTVRLERDHVQGMITDANKAKLEKKLSDLNVRLEAADKELSAAAAEVADVNAKLDALRAEYAVDPEFAKYDAMLDDGIDLARLKYNEMRLFRKDLQIIFQDPYSSLNPRMTIGQIIEEGLVTHNFFKAGSEKMREHIVKTMVECGLQEYMLHRYPHQFSGGQPDK